MLQINLEHLSEEELVALNRKIVTRVTQMRRERNPNEKFRFVVGDPVMFNHPNGGIGTGVVVKCNKKTIDVDGDDGTEWRVSPMSLVHAITKQFVPSPGIAGPRVWGLD